MNPSALHASATLIPLRHRMIALWCRQREHPAKQRLLRWIKWLLRVGDVQTLVAPGVVLSLDPDDYVQREILFRKAYEPATLTLVERLLADATCFVDVGAHVGQFSLVAAAALRGRGHVYSFEPTPKTAARLLHNIQLSQASNIRVFTFGVSDGHTLAHFAEPQSAPNQPKNWGGTRISAQRTAAGYTTATVPLARVAEFERWTRLDVVKIDVEGHEAHVLQSLFDDRVPRPRHIVLEFIPDAFAEARRVPALLRQHGYELRDVTGRPFDETGAAPLPESNLWASLS